MCALRGPDLVKTIKELGIEPNNDLKKNHVKMETETTYKSVVSNSFPSQVSGSE